MLCINVHTSQQTRNRITAKTYVKYQLVHSLREGARQGTPRARHGLTGFDLEESDLKKLANVLTDLTATLP
jgi:hypothetical protein